MKRRITPKTLGFVVVGVALVLAGSAQAQTTTGPVKKLKAAAIKVTMIESNEIKLPAEFQVSLYEDLIQQLQSKRGVPKVYREGDRNADTVADLVVLRTTVTGFKEGSERLRQVTTVAGATSITVARAGHQGQRAFFRREPSGYLRFCQEDCEAGAR
jgi:hypothetical protein